MSQTEHFKTVDYPILPDAYVYEKEYRDGWVVYIQPVAIKKFDPQRGDRQFWQVTFSKRLT